MTNPIFYNEWLSENQQKWMRHYKKLCSNDTLRKSEFYEDHHVLPLCLGGTVGKIYKREKDNYE